MIKVYLLVGKLPFYQDLIRYPPKGVEYLPKKYSYGQDILTYYSSAAHLLKRKISSILLEKFKLPRMTCIFNDSSDLIHSNRGILILNRKPWIIDIDYVGYFFGEKIQSSYLKSVVSKFLLSAHCKKIICWSNAARLSINNVFKSDKINDKTEILYPAIPAIRKIKKQKSDKIKLLYVSSSFVKGGKELLSAFKILLEKYDNIELIFKCDVPENIKKEHNFKEIQFFAYRSQLLPRDELIRKFHMNSDIFVYPTFGDLFGLGLLDAMVAELPIITTRQFAIPEIVKDGKNGFLITPWYTWYYKNYLPRKNVKIIRSKNGFIKELVEKLSLLIEDSSLRKRMGKNGRRLVEKGKFSIKERNKKLANIYKMAIK
jgi:glycosyltransferase involved in cell wall biosynthesis